MQAIQESAQYYYVNSIKPFITNPFFMSIYNVLSVISLKIVLITTTIYEFSKYYIPIAYNWVYNFCSKYIPEVYQFLYAFIEALNNNYGDDDNNNNVDETNISSPKKPIIDSSWCNVDVKNIISAPDVTYDANNDVNDDVNDDSDNNVNDDDGSTLPRPPPGVWNDDGADDVANDANNVNTNDELNNENTQDDQSEEDKKNQ